MEIALGREIRAGCLIAVLAITNAFFYSQLAIVRQEFPMWLNILVFALIYLALAFFAGAFTHPLFPLQFKEIIPVAIMVPLSAVALFIWWESKLGPLNGLLAVPVLAYKLMGFGGGWDVYLFLLCNTVATGIGLYAGHYRYNAGNYTQRYF